MKSLLFLSCVVVGLANALDPALMDEMMEKVQEFGIECSETEKATEEDMMALMEKKVPKTHEGKCTLFCVNKKLNMMNPDGTFGPGYVVWLNKVKADDPKFYTALMSINHICEETAMKQEDHCERAASMFKCIKEEGIKSELDKMF